MEEGEGLKQQHVYTSNFLHHNIPGVMVGNGIPGGGAGGAGGGGTIAGGAAEGYPTGWVGPLAIISRYEGGPVNPTDGGGGGGGGMFCWGAPKLPGAGGGGGGGGADDGCDKAC